MTYRIFEPLLLSCAHPVQLTGDSEVSVAISDSGDFPAMVLVPSTYASQSVGTISATSLVTGPGAAINFDGHPWYLNLDDALVNVFAPSAYPLNGLSQLDVRLFFKSGSLANPNWLFYMGGNQFGDGGSVVGVQAGLWAGSTGDSALCFELTTGGVAHQACGAASAITTGIVEEIEMAYNGSNIYVFLNGTQISGSPFAATGTVTQSPYTNLIAGTAIQSYPDWGTSSGSFVGQIDSYQISNIARHSSNYTADTAKFTSDSNTLLLVNGKSFNNPLIAVDKAESATDGWLIARGGSGSQGAATYIKDLSIQNGTLGIFQALEPGTQMANVSIQTSWIGLELWNNNYEGTFDHLRFSQGGASESAITATGAEGVEDFNYPQIITMGYHGIEGFDLSGQLHHPFIAPSTNSVDAIYSDADNQFEDLSVYDAAIDTENGGSATGLLIFGGGSYHIFGGDFQPGRSAPCFEIQPSTLLGVEFYGSKCTTIGGSPPGELVDFIGSGTLVTPVVWFNPIVNHTSYSGQTAIPWSNAPTKLVVYGDVLQPPVKTVATLPTCNSAAKGWVVQVKDCNANCTTYLGTSFTGGGSTRSTVQCNGTAWELH